MKHSQARAISTALAAFCVSACGAYAEGGDYEEAVGLVQAPIRVGTETSAFPEAVHIRMRGAGSCSATTVSDRVILTAAHCVEHLSDGVTDDITVWRNNGTTTGNRVDLLFAGSLNLRKHPRHRGDWGAFDVAVLTTEDGVTLPGVTHARLYSGEWDFWKVGRGGRFPTPKLSFDAVGFGTGSDADVCAENPDTIKRQASFRISGVSSFVGGHHKSGRNGPPQMLSAYESPAMICPGDSGGPALLDGMLIGVASGSSWGKNFPSGRNWAKGHWVFMRTHLDWLQEAVADTGVHMVCEELGSDDLVTRSVPGRRASTAVVHSQSTSDEHLLCTHPPRPEPPAPDPIDHLYDQCQQICGSDPECMSVVPDCQLFR